MNGKNFPFSPSPKKYGQEVRLLFRNPGINIVERFSNTTGLMQSPETISIASRVYTAGRAQEGYRYCEMTVAPQYHTFNGLTEAEVVGALIQGIKRGEEEFPDIEVDLLFTIGREVESQEAVRLVNAAAEAAGRYGAEYVAGIGLACDEASHPPEKHAAMFKRAKELGFRTTCHAGEWVNVPDCENNARRAELSRPQLLKNMAVALYDLGVDRIGHAIPLPYGRDLLSYVVSRKIGIEWCPGSNFASGLIPDVHYLRMPDLISCGVLGCINADDDLFLPDMDEVVRLCGFTARQLLQMEKNAWATRFGHRKHNN
jgi:adenosine deaminase